MLHDCDAVYVMAPNMLAEEPHFVHEIVKAARTMGISRIVYHSVAAPYAPDMPHHVGKAEAEDIVRKSGTEWTILQPCAYVQNFLPAVQHGTIDIAYDPDRLFGLVDLDDVGRAAAAVLKDDRHIGATYELGGPDLVSVTDVAHSAERILGGRIAIRRITEAEWSAGSGAALSGRERRWLCAMFRYYDEYGLAAGGMQLAALLGHPANTVATVVRRDLVGNLCPGSP